MTDPWSGLLRITDPIVWVPVRPLTARPDAARDDGDRARVLKMIAESCPIVLDDIGKSAGVLT
jgi:hypothetical protein